VRDRACYTVPIWITSSSPAWPQAVQRRARVLAAPQLLAIRVTVRRGRPRPLRLDLLSARAADLELTHSGDQKYPVKLHHPLHSTRNPSDQFKFSNTFAISLQTQCTPRNPPCPSQSPGCRLSSSTPAGTAAVRLLRGHAVPEGNTPCQQLFTVPLIPQKLMRLPFFFGRELEDLLPSPAL